MGAIRAYVINLPQSTERRAHIEGQLRAAGIEHELVPAVDGMRLSDEERARRVDLETVARAPQWLLPGIQGAALSHIDTYRLIARRGEPCALVVEDDVVIPAGASALLDAVADNLRGAEVALLYFRAWAGLQLRARSAVALPGAARLMEPVDPAPLTAAGAYVVTAQACVRLAAQLEPVHAGPDSWGLFQSEGALDRVRCVVPRPFGARTDFKSTIGYLGDAGSPLQRVLQVVAARRPPGLHHALAWRRARLERRMSAYTIVDD